MSSNQTPVLRLRQVGFVRAHKPILTNVSWTIEPAQRWAVLGANGSGKTTLLQIAALYEHPSCGSVELLGQKLGKADVRELRQRVGFVSASLAQMLRPHLTATDVVMTARYGALEPWWHTYSQADRLRAEQLLEDVGAGGLGQRSIGTLSSGERQRVQLARSLMTNPALVLLDEPASALDLAGREMLIADLARIANNPASPALVMVTHRVEEIPPGFTHGLLLRNGEVLAQGPLEHVLTSAQLSACFGISLELGHRNGRWHAQAQTPS